MTNNGCHKGYWNSRLGRFLIAFTLIFGLGWLALMTAPSLRSPRYEIVGQRLNAQRKGILLGECLEDFKDEYGCYPDNETAMTIYQQFGNREWRLSGCFSNDYFRQLVAAGIAKGEDFAYLKTSYTPSMPDGVMTGNEALKAGEVGFGYILNGGKAIGTDNSERIIAVTPLLNAQADGQFDQRPLGGKALVVYVGGNVKFVDIQNDNKIRLGHTVSLLDIGVGTIWGKEVRPVIRPPMPIER